MANSANTNTVPKLYRSVIEDVINDVRDIFLDDGVDEQVLMELKTLWENKLMQSRAVDGFHSEEQQLLLQVQQQHQTQQQQHHHHHHHQQAQPQPTVPQQAQTQQVLIPAAQQAAAPQVIVPDSKLIQHMNASNMSAAATAATLALPAGVTPVQQILTNSGQLLQVVRAANGAQYIFQPQQSVVLQQQVIPQMQPGGVQAPVIQQVLAPLPGGISPQTGVIIQPQQILFTGNKTQVIPTTVAAPTPAQAQITATGQQQPQAQPAQQQAPLVLQVDGTGDTSSEEDEDEEEDYDDDEEEDKEKDGAEDGQVEEQQQGRKKSRQYIFRHVVNTMKLWTPLLTTFLCAVPLAVLAEIKERPGLEDKTLIEECWGNPDIRECTRKCSKSFKCANVNYTCCWSYCGNICWKTTTIYAR